MHASVVQRIRDSPTEHLLHMLQEAPDDWSEPALEAARSELRARAVEWREKPAESPSSTPWWAKLTYALLGLGGGAVGMVLVFGYGMSPRWLILVAALTGSLGFTVPRRPRR